MRDNCPVINPRHYKKVYIVWRARFARKNEYAQTNKAFKQNPAGFEG
jgi:hypothetical protein